MKTCCTMSLFQSRSKEGGLVTTSGVSTWCDVHWAVRNEASVPQTQFISRAPDGPAWGGTDFPGPRDQEQTRLKNVFLIKATEIKDLNRGVMAEH